MNLLWIKKNQILLTVLAALAVLAVAAVPFWLHRCEQRDLAASQAYSDALKLSKKEEIREAMEKVTTQYAGSKVSRLAELYSAHLSLQLGEAEKAQKTYEAFLAKAGPKDPLRPLAMAGLKASYEALKQPEKAKNLEADLEKLGFYEK